MFILTPPLGPQALKLYPAGEDRFFLVDGNIEVTFIRDSGGTVELRILAGKEKATAKKVR